MGLLYRYKFSYKQLNEWTNKAIKVWNRDLRSIVILLNNRYDILVRVAKDILQWSVHFTIN